MARKGPTMGLVRRMGEVNPERLADEVGVLRKENENLRLALGVKVATYVRSLHLDKGDILVVKHPKGNTIPPESIAAVLEHAAKLLKDRLGWEVPVLFESQATVEKKVGGSGDQH